MSCPNNPVRSRSNSLVASTVAVVACPTSCKSVAAYPIRDASLVRLMTTAGIAESQTPSVSSVVTLIVSEMRILWDAITFEPNQCENSRSELVDSAFFFRQVARVNKLELKTRVVLLDICLHCANLRPPVSTCVSNLAFCCSVITTT